jgi:hypothetical protein
MNGARGIGGLYVLATRHPILRKGLNVGFPDSVLIPDITSQESNGERMAPAAFWMN